MRVSNRADEAKNCLSQSVLYYVNGGMFRPVSLVVTGPVMFEPFMGSTGLLLTPSGIDNQQPAINAKAYCRNTTDAPVQATLQYAADDPDGKRVAKVTQQVMLQPGELQEVSTPLPIQDPKLWGLGEPNLYRITAELIVDEQPTDGLIEHTGFRTIRMDDGQFELNGQPFLVRGFNKHQQNESKWNAVTHDDLLAEWELMYSLRPNTVRLAHYPHAQIEYRIADRLGIAIWAENGLAGQRWDRSPDKATGEQTWHADGERITREMVYQNWNHPSIVFWSSGNETNREVASHYAAVIRQLDTSRLITYASAGEKPTDVDFVAHNTYQGWYYAHFSDFAKLPENAYISETGCGTWPTQHIPIGTVRWQVDHFEPEEYGQLYTEFRLQSVFRNHPEGHKMYLWWNFREFYDHKFKQNRNTKGLVYLAGKPKDLFYLHQAFYRPDYPVLRICDQQHFYRQSAAYGAVKVYSNAKHVELFVNGKSQGQRANGAYVQPDTPRKQDEPNGAQVKGTAIDNVFLWEAPLTPGRNVVEARDDRGQSQQAVFYLASDDALAGVRSWPN